jgi:hypothetical protein
LIVNSQAAAPFCTTDVVFTVFLSRITIGRAVRNTGPSLMQGLAPNNTYLDMAASFGIATGGRNRGGKPDSRECGSNANQSHWTANLKSEIVNLVRSKPPPRDYLLGSSP